ncbi:hypothetical protein GWN26_08435 [Candidatus Saccharibacteria bacterium]|nr:hypothetical protein [Candidatus Saccharibacteria bacterium]NIV03884.1 hypothetical protein [Calditrichia bacterium]NIS38449.1 hypothetical protein [Candidatus Saccharibacteria bacterium]NIV72217.1 hypothetical protein [Calditrichia bacterium]NIV99158.1 hypothetical protein [Candidatus Saccharibacteria bacterium]
MACLNQQLFFISRGNAIGAWSDYYLASFASALDAFQAAEEDRLDDYTVWSYNENGTPYAVDYSEAF